MYGVSKISSEQNIMLTTFPGAQYSAQSLAEHLDVFAKAGIVVDMICQSAPRGSAVDFSFTTSYDNFAAVMKALPAAAKANPPLVSGGYSKINLFGEEMVTSCGVAARALAALAGAGIEIVLITTSDLDISLLIRQQDEDTALDALHKAFAGLTVPLIKKRRCRPHLKGCTCFLFYSCGSTLLPEMAGIQPHTCMAADCHICPS